jgi:hypothetical protein
MQWRRRTADRRYKGGSGEEKTGGGGWKGVRRRGERGVGREEWGERRGERGEGRISSLKQHWTLTKAAMTSTF